MTKIILLRMLEISVCLVCGYLYQFRLEPFKTLQSSVGSLKNTRVNEGNIEVSFLFFDNSVFFSLIKRKQLICM